MTAERLQIGEFAKLAKTNLRTLRYYEELGLLTPAERSNGGFRRYDPNQADRVAAIKRLQDLGLSLKQIQQTIAEPNCAEGACGQAAIVERVGAAIDQQARLVEDRIRRLGEDLEALAQAKARLAECGRCDRQLDRESCDPCPRDHTPLNPVIRALL